MDKRRTLFINNDQRVYFECEDCGKARGILDHDRASLSHLPKCKCQRTHYKQVLRDLPYYDPIKERDP